MRTFPRYLLTELLVPLGVWVPFLFLILFVMYFLRGTEVVLGSAVNVLDVGRLLLYMAPHFLVMALPIAFLLSILLGLGRLSEDRELVALHSLGVGPWQLLWAPLGIGVVLSGVMLLFAFTFEPRGLQAVQGLVKEVIKKNVANDVRPGVFYDDLSTYTFYVERISPKSRRWGNILVYDEQDSSEPLLVLAQDGHVNPATSADAALNLLLGEGNVHLANRSTSDYSVIGFERGEIAVRVDEAVSSKNRFKAPKEELTPFELLEAAEQAKAQGQNPAPFLMAFHSRFGQAFTPISFALIGTPLAMSRQRSGRARGYFLTLVAYVGYYLVFKAFDNWGVQGKLPYFWAAQMPNVVMLSLGVIALARVMRIGGGR